MSNQPTATAKWDPWNMFDVSEKERNIMKKRQALINKNKEKFRELVNDPKAQGRGGWLLDPAVQRWYTSRATQRNWFRPDLRSFAIAFAGVVVPIVSLFVTISRRKAEEEKLHKAGKIPILTRQNRYHY